MIANLYTSRADIYHINARAGPNRVLCAYNIITIIVIIIHVTTTTTTTAPSGGVRGRRRNQMTENNDRGFFFFFLILLCLAQPHMSVFPSAPVTSYESVFFPRCFLTVSWRHRRRARYPLDGGVADPSRVKLSSDGGVAAYGLRAADVITLTV